MIDIIAMYTGYFVLLYCGYKVLQFFYTLLFHMDEVKAKLAEKTMEEMMKKVKKP